MTDTNNELPDWFVRIMSRPLLVIVLLATLVVGIPALVAVYLDHRISTIADPNDVRPANEPSGAEPAELPKSALVGQTVYVPVYSHVYQGRGERLMLAATLSIRNTDDRHALTISAIRYYDTEGNLVRDYLKTPLKLKPMGSTDFLVKEADAAGGSGANFIVEWVSDEPVREPIIEAVMVGRKGSGFATFARPGVVTKQLRKSP